MYEFIGAALTIMSLLGCMALAWWLVFTYVEPGPPRRKKPVVLRDYAPRESVDAHLTRGLITVLLLDMFCGHKD